MSDMTIDVGERRFLVDVTRTDGSPVQLVLADERDVEWFNGRKRTGCSDFIGGSKLIGGLVDVRIWRRPLGVLTTFVGTPHT